MTGAGFDETLMGRRDVGAACGDPRLQRVGVFACGVVQRLDLAHANRPPIGSRSICHAARA